MALIREWFLLLPQAVLNETLGFRRPQTCSQGQRVGNLQTDRLCAALDSQPFGVSPSGESLCSGTLF